MQLRRFNNLGLDRFTAFLDGLRSGISVPYPKELLLSNELTELIEPVCDIESRIFGSRFAAAQYLDHQLSNAGIPNLIRDKGMWAWLAFFYFEELCPEKKEGQRTPGAPARWIPEVSNFRRYYRHLLAGPYRIYLAHRDNPKRAMALLCGQLDKPGEVVEQLAARQEVITNKGVIELATKLYFDDTGQHLKRGSSGKGKGSPRRFADVLNQFEVTWDVYSMSSDDVVKLLPNEFRRFLD